MDDPLFTGFHTPIHSHSRLNIFDAVGRIFCLVFVYNAMRQVYKPPNCAHWDIPL